MACAGRAAYAAPDLESAATAVAQAHASKAAAELAKLAARPEPDPFLVAEVLCERAGDAARAFAAAAPGADVRRLASYVAGRLKTPPAAADIASLLAASAERERKDWPALVRRTAGAKDTVVDVAIDMWRAEALRATGNTAAAADAFLAAARRAHRIGWMYSAALAYFQGARACHRALRYGDMLESFRKLGDVERAREEPRGQAMAFLYQGQVHTEIGQYPQALKSLARARRAFEKLGEPDMIARVLRASASAHRRLGENSRALVLAEQGLVMVRSPRWRARLLTTLGIIRRAIGENDGALEADQAALAVVRELNNPGWTAELSLNVGNSLAATGDYEGAHAAFTEALATFERIKHPGFTATALTNLGFLALLRDRPEEALSLCRRALTVAQASEDQLLIVLAELNVALSLLRLGRHGAATAAFETTIAHAERLRARTQLLEGRLGLAECRLAQGDARAAFESARAGIDQLGAMVGGLAEGQEAEARAHHARLFEVAAEAAARLDDPTAFAFVLETGRAMALLESLEGREKLRNVSIPAAYREEEGAARAAVTEARTVYRRAIKAGPRSVVKKRRDELSAATKRLEDVIGRIRRAAKDHAALVYPQADDLATLTRHLEPEDAFVLYALTQHDYLALVIGPTAARIVKLGKREDVDAACAAVVAATKDGSKDARGELAALSALVVDPLKLAASVRRVLVSPTGDLYLVPLSAVVGRRRLAYVPSGTAYGVLRAAKAQRGKAVVAFGDIDYSSYGRLPALPGSADESKAVGDVVLLGKDATENAVRTVLPSRARWRAVHFACHGILDLKRPMRSALALTKQAPDDGRLSVVEVFTAKVPADLVVLSACETGRGRIYRAEGIIGLTRAFMHAGAPRVLCSLWKVDDDATRALMIKFYELWNPKQGKGLSAAAALKKAQEHIRAQPKWKAPFYWGAWVLWGLPD